MYKSFSGNPITSKGKRIQLVRMVALVTVPIVVLLGLVGNILQSQVTIWAGSNRLREFISFNRNLGQLIHNLQVERDMTALYVSAIGPDTKDFLVRVYPRTDGALENLTEWPVATTNNMKEFQSKDAFQTFLNRHRYELDIRNATSKSEIGFYVGLMDVFERYVISYKFEKNLK